MPTSFERAQAQLKKIVKQLVDLNFRGKLGVSKKENLESARNQLKKLGKSDEELDEMFKELTLVEIEKGTEHLLSVFSALSSSRAEGVNGPMPISYVEIKTYCELMDENLTPWEIETIREMDREFLATVSQKIEEQKE